MIAGTRRWILIAGFQLQPSELVKLAAALFVAKVFSEYRQESLGLRDIALPGAAVGLLVAPDRARARPRHGGLPGAALPRASRSWPGCACARWRRSRRVLLLVAGARAGRSSRTTRRRASTPSSTPRSTRAAPATRRSSRRSRWARAASSGKGFRQGSQAQLGYLPARHTDFVFSVLAEEIGLPRAWSVVLGALPARRCGGCSRPRGSRATALGAFLVAGHRGELRLPGRVQCRHGRGARAREGPAAAAHELWRLLGALVAHGHRPRPQRPDAALRELTLRAARLVDAPGGPPPLRHPE